MKDQSNIFVITDETYCSNEPDFKIHVDDSGKLRNLVVNCSAGEDNHSDIHLINEMMSLKVGDINVLDLGCAGGNLILDLAARPETNICIGIDGSPGVYKHANWHVETNRQVLLFANLVAPFFIRDKDSVEPDFSPSPVDFDYVSCYEVIEHFREDQLETFFTNVKNHLKEDGIFFGSIALFPDTRDSRGFHARQEGYDPTSEQFVLHKTVYQSREPWDKIMGEFFDVIEHPWNVKMRNHEESYYFACKTKGSQ